MVSSHTHKVEHGKKNKSLNSRNTNIFGYVFKLPYMSLFNAHEYLTNELWNSIAYRELVYKCSICNGIQHFCDLNSQPKRYLTSYGDNKNEPNF